MTEIRGVVLLAPLAPAIGGNGLAMRAGMLLETLAQETAVHLVVVPVSGSADDLEWASGLARSVHVVAPVSAERAREHVTTQLADARLRDHLERTVPLPARATAAPPTLAPEVVGSLRSRTGPVAVLGLRAYLAPLATEIATQIGAARLVVDLDDDDATLLRALGATAEADAFDRLGRVWLPHADVVVTASPVDADAVTDRYALRRVHVVPNAVRPPSFVAPPPDTARLLFVGNLTYQPNVDAATVLVDEVLPAVRSQRTDAAVDLVGPSVPGALDRLTAVPGVHASGYVPDLAPSYAKAALVVVPLRHGAGTRIKVLEAFAFGRPVVATPAAVAGLAVATGKDVVVADTSEALADAVVGLLDDPGRAAAIAQRARRTFEERYVPEVVGPVLRRVVVDSPPL